MIDCLIVCFRFIGTRSPIASKYRRVIDGMELIPEDRKTGTPTTSADPQVATNRSEARQSVYRKLFGPEIVASSPVKKGSNKESAS